MTRRFLAFLGRVPAGGQHGGIMCARLGHPAPMGRNSRIDVELALRFWGHPSTPLAVYRAPAGLDRQPEWTRMGQDVHGCAAHVAAGAAVGPWGLDASVAFWGMHDPTPTCKNHAASTCTRCMHKCATHNCVHAQVCMQARVRERVPRTQARRHASTHARMPGCCCRLLMACCPAAAAGCAGGHPALPQRRGTLGAAPAPLPLPLPPSRRLLCLLRGSCSSVAAAPAPAAA